MRIELQNNQLDLGSTPIENMFINTYLYQANEVQIKVYIYALSQAYNKSENISNENIAREMNLTEGQVVDAWKYWIDQEIVEKVGDTYIFKSLVYKYISAVSKSETEMAYTPKIHVTSANPQWLDNSEDAVASRELINNIEDFISQGNTVKTKLNTREIKIIIELMNEFNISSEFLSSAYMMASNIRGLRAVDPVIATVRNWLIDGATDFEKLEIYLENKEKKKEDKKERKTNYISKDNKGDNLINKDNRMSKEDRDAFVEMKLNKKLPINRRNNK